MAGRVILNIWRDIIVRLRVRFYIDALVTAEISTPHIEYTLKHAQNTFFKGVGANDQPLV